MYNGRNDLNMVTGKLKVNICKVCGKKFVSLTAKYCYTCYNKSLKQKREK